MYICSTYNIYIYIMLRVKDILKEKGMTQKELATKIGIAEISLSRSIATNGNPTLDTLTKIANALDVPVEELFMSNKGIIQCPFCKRDIKIKIE